MYCINYHTMPWQGDFFFFAAYALYILYNIALYLKVQKSDTKIKKEPRVY